MENEKTDYNAMIKEAKMDIYKINQTAIITTEGGYQIKAYRETFFYTAKEWTNKIGEPYNLPLVYEVTDVKTQISDRVDLTDAEIEELRAIWRG